jgi:hypothetical protein
VVYLVFQLLLLRRPIMANKEVTPAGVVITRKQLRLISGRVRAIRAIALDNSVAEKVTHNLVSSVLSALHTQGYAAARKVAIAKVELLGGLIIDAAMLNARKAVKAERKARKAAYVARVNARKNKGSDRKVGTLIIIDPTMGKIVPMTFESIGSIIGVKTTATEAVVVLSNKAWFGSNELLAEMSYNLFTLVRAMKNGRTRVPTESDYSDVVREVGIVATVDMVRKSYAEMVTRRFYAANATFDSIDAEDAFVDDDVVTSTEPTKAELKAAAKAERVRLNRLNNGWLTRATKLVDAVKAKAEMIGRKDYCFQLKLIASTEFEKLNELSSSLATNLVFKLTGYNFQFDIKSFC